MAAHAHAAKHEIRNPGPYQISPTLKTLLIVFVLLGIASFVILMASDPKRAWSIFVIDHFYFLSLALGGIFFAVIQWLTGAMWSAPVRRLGEAFTAYLPVAGLTLIGLFVGAALGHVYEWTHADEVAKDMVLQHKSGYLNVIFFVLRNLVVFAALFFFTRRFIQNSVAQDSTKAFGLTLRNRSMAPVFLIVFALGFTMMSFDQIMSLAPHWFSTIFGIYCFAGLFYSTLAAMCMLAIMLRRQGALEGIVNHNHVHDLGKFMFAFSIFWAYIGFSQFMLIWYANLPEETSYYLLRFDGGWRWVSIFLLAKFIVPFLILLPRGSKRAETRLFWVGAFMLVAQWIDVLWMVQPQFFPDGPKVSLFEVGVTLGFAGVFGLTVARFLGKHNIAAIGDPRIAEAVHHHHQ